jgi:toxin-antitoxin system PIN domain toxin
VIAVDTNILVYAHREDSTWHDSAYARLLDLAQGRDSWAIPWPCLHEFLAIVTHPRIYFPPTPLERALDQVQAWLESPSLVLLSEAEDHWRHLQALLRSARACGPKVHDARVAALCIANEITELWTADRDFSHFRRFRTRNPLIP